MKKNFFKNHTLLMIGLCVLPIIILGVFLIKGFNNSALPFLLILLCPLGHLFLMRDHGKGKDGHH